MYEFEARLVYNHQDRKYYIYSGEDYVADEENLSDALVWFLSLVNMDVTGTWRKNVLTQCYGKRKKITVPEELLGKEE